jgi:hypothetical protein
MRATRTWRPRPDWSRLHDGRIWDRDKKSPATFGERGFLTDDFISEVPCEDQEHIHRLVFYRGRTLHGNVRAWGESTLLQRVAIHDVFDVFSTDAAGRHQRIALRGRSIRGETQAVSPQAVDGPSKVSAQSIHAVGEINERAAVCVAETSLFFQEPLHACVASRTDSPADKAQRTTMNGDPLRFGQLQPGATVGVVQGGDR